MTVLIQEMSSTIVAAINRGTFVLADWTVLPKKGVFRELIESQPRLRDWLQGVSERQKQTRRLREGFQVQSPDENPNLTGRDAAGEGPSPEETEKNLERLTREASSDHELARELARAIKKVAHDISVHPPVRYSYEQWVYFTQLIRFSTRSKDEVEALEEEEGLVEWDWIGEDSPMLADETESQWILDRLCESLNRYMRKLAAKVGGDAVQLHEKRGALTKLQTEGSFLDAGFPRTIEEEEENGGPSTDRSLLGSRVASPNDDMTEVKLWAEKMGSRAEGV